MKPSTWLAPDAATAEYMARRLYVEWPEVMRRLHAQQQRLAAPRDLSQCMHCGAAMWASAARRYCSARCQVAAKRQRQRAARQAGYAALRRGR